MLISAGKASSLSIMTQPSGSYTLINGMLASSEYNQKFGTQMVPGDGRPGCVCATVVSSSGSTGSTGPSTPPTTTRRFLRFLFRKSNFSTFLSD